MIRHNTKNIIVLGDVMLDINYISNNSPTRNAPESQNVNVYKVDKVNYILGGAANVAAGFSSLGYNVTLFGIVGGMDNFAAIMEKLLKKKNIKSYLIHGDKNLVKPRPTTQKHRTFLNNILISRFDVEETHTIDNGTVKFLKGLIKRHIEENDISAIVFSDYNKGFLTEDLCSYIISYANHHGIYTFVDPKTENCTKYRNCFCFKPNFCEAHEIAKCAAASTTDTSLIHDTSSLEKTVISIQNIIQSKHILITDGENGLYLYSQDSNHIHHIKHHIYISVHDVTGAGDSVLVSFVYAFLQKMDVYLAAQVANIIGGKSVTVIGNYQLKQDSIDTIIKTMTSSSVALDTVTSIKVMAEKMGSTIVFTNGCFDILHSAHLRLLNFAKSCGDILVVGLNTDSSIKRLKGDMRPINNEVERVAALRELRGIVDYVVLFDDDTPVRILEILRPNVLVKGGDYKKEQIIGREFAERVEIFPFVEGKSTSKIISAVMDSVQK